MINTNPISPEFYKFAMEYHNKLEMEKLTKNLSKLRMKRKREEFTIEEFDNIVRISKKKHIHPFQLRKRQKLN